MKKIVEPVIAITLSLCLVACGSSSSGTQATKSTNKAPVVLAGEDQSITLPENTVSLSGSVNDGSPYTVLWELVSGPEGITFSTQSATNTSVEFSQSGSYTLRLTADDGEFTVSDDVIITVNDMQNQPPTVKSGEDLNITLPTNSADLMAEVNDDGEYTLLWTQIAGPSDVIFADKLSTLTQVEFSQSGSYTLRLTADDGEFVVSDDVVITVNSSQLPKVMAGIDQSIPFPTNTVNLAPTVSYDGAYTTLWTKVSGPGTVIFANALAEYTSADFSDKGVYTLRLTADNGELVVSDDVVITVESDTDSFGITKLYQTATGFTDWESTAWHNGLSRTVYGRDYSDTTGWSQKRGDDVLQIDGNGIMEMGGGNQPRIYINPYPGNEETNPEQFFKNVEATVYYKRIGDDGATNGGLVIGLRSGPNGHSSSGDFCDATTYYARFRHDGYWDFYKELKHTDGATAKRTMLYPGRLPSEQWIGMKFIAYNINNDTNVKLELYIDKTSNGDVTNGGEWTLVGEMVDDGSWSVPEDVSSCSYSNNHIITTGGGTVLIRNTGVLTAEYKYFSVREIDASLD